MNSAIICVLFVLLGTLMSAGTSAVPVSSHIEQYTDHNQELIDHLANLKAHVQSPSVRKLLKAVKESTKDVDVAVFVQNLLDSQAQDMTGQSAFGRKEAKAAFAAFQSLPRKNKNTDVCLYHFWYYSYLYYSYDWVCCW